VALGFLEESHHNLSFTSTIVRIVTLWFIGSVKFTVERVNAFSTL
jgi:hypothetical protein